MTRMGNFYRNTDIMTKRRIIYSIKGSLLIMAVLVACWACKKESFRVNLSGSETNISITRFEDTLFMADPSNFETCIPRWKKEFGGFFQNYCYVLRLGNVDDPGFAQRLRSFATDHFSYMIYSRLKQVYPDLNQLTSSLNGAFSHYHYYFPDKVIPRIFTYAAGFNQSAITDDSLLAIGLDRYLGKNEELYKQVDIYNYLVKNMNPERITPDCMYYWAETEFPYNDSIDNLVTNMIYQGTLLYFVGAMVPDSPDSVKWGFTQKELDYMIANEKPMWGYLVEQKLLFKSDRFTMNKFILEGPFTKDFGRDSPARAAIWIGYRIVSSYMKNNQRITLPMLMNERNYMKIMNLSEYNP
jgi:hypothetical protein